MSITCAAALAISLASMNLGVVYRAKKLSAVWGTMPEKKREVSAAVGGTPSSNKVRGQGRKHCNSGPHLR